MAINLGKRVRQFGVGGKLALFAESFLQGYWNESSDDQKTNGENFVLMAVGKYFGATPITVFDVGANRGQWALNCLKYCPRTLLHCFELVPETCQRLKDVLKNRSVESLNDFGLSDENATVEVAYYPASDTGSSIEPLPWSLKSQQVRCDTVKGSDYCREKKIEIIHMLKIDTEGHEMKVLHGFDEMLTKGQIYMIQFEYGKTWLPPHCQLADAYAFLSPRGYAIGRLFPKGVQFSEYSMFRDEHYRMGNYIAVRQEHKDLIKKLQNLRPVYGDV